MGRFKPIKQTRVSEVVLSQLKEAILLGDYLSGQKLPSERELTEQFQVSRGVIREAIRVLEVTGFVVTKQGQAGGAYVTTLSFDHISSAFIDLFLANKISIPELTKVRSHIEPEIARMTAGRITEKEKWWLKEAQEAELLTPRDYSDRVDRFQKVHLILAELCANSFFEAIAKSMIKLTKKIVLAVEPDHNALHMPGEHRAIVDAVCDGNPEDAALAMKAHLGKFCGSLVEMEAAYRAKMGTPE
jgi:DNA-binding FadR family transcriptional regulator